MKALPWFRMYHEALDDEKLRLLACEDRWHFVALLCCKAKGILDEGGSLLRRKVAVKLGLSTNELDEVARRLAEVGLINSSTLQPLAWDERQMQSDSSYERVKRHREKRAAAGLPQQNFIRPDVRANVFERDSHSCVYCKSTDDLTIDHDIPQSKGGGDEMSNLLTACRRCNASKRDLTASEFRANSMKRFSNGADKEEDTDKEEDKKNKKKATGVATPSGVSDSVFQDFKKLRTAKKSPLTQTALDGITREAAKGGISLSTALEMCCERGWVGFKSEWLVEKRTGYLPPQPNETVPSRQGIDPTLAQIIADRLHTKPPSDAIRAQLAKLRSAA